jgi:hypothetical protein
VCYTEIRLHTKVIRGSLLQACYCSTKLEKADVAASRAENQFSILSKLLGGFILFCFPVHESYGQPSAPECMVDLLWLLEGSKL